MKSKELFFIADVDAQHDKGLKKILLHLWGGVNQFFRLTPKCCSFFRVWLLRLFGAHIKNGCYISKYAIISHP